MRTIRGLAAAALVLLAACGGGGGSRPEATCSPAGPVLEITAANVAFDTACLAAPRGQAITIEFRNGDAGTPHNVSILTAAGATLFKGDVTTGVKTITYHVKALKAETYRFRCDVHPDTMDGTFIVR